MSRVAIRELMDYPLNQQKKKKEKKRTNARREEVINTLMARLTGIFIRVT